MARREFYVEKKVCDYAASLGWRNRKVEYVGRRGCPDRWFTRRDGELVIIEFKDLNGALSPPQRKEIAYLRGAGFEVHVVDDIDEGKAIFDAHE